jgi:hypothetical protein
VIVAIYQYFRVVKHKKQITKTFEVASPHSREDLHEKVYATMLCKRLTYLELRFVSSATRGRGEGKGRGEERKGRERIRA